MQQRKATFLLIHSPSRSSQYESLQIFWLYLLKNESRFRTQGSGKPSKIQTSCKSWLCTSEEQRLTEITPQIMLTHCLNSEQVQDIRGHVGDNRLLQEETCTHVDTSGLCRELCTCCILAQCKDKWQRQTRCFTFRHSTHKQPFKENKHFCCLLQQWEQIKTKYAGNCRTSRPSHEDLKDTGWRNKCLRWMEDTVQYSALLTICDFRQLQVCFNNGVQHWLFKWHVTCAHEGGTHWCHGSLVEPGDLRL